MARGDVLLVGLSASNAREQSGRRPAVAVQTDVAGEPMVMIAPITSNLNARRFAFTVQTHPSREHGLSVPSVAMVFQLRAIDKARIVRKLGQMSASDMARIDAEIWRMLKPPEADSDDG